MLEDELDFSQTSEQVGIPVSNQSSFSDIKQNEIDGLSRWRFRLACQSVG